MSRLTISYFPSTKQASQWNKGGSKVFANIETGQRPLAGAVPGCPWSGGEEWEVASQRRHAMTESAQCDRSLD